MRILALETSGMSGSAAVLDTATDAAPWVVPLKAGQRSAQALVPAIKAAIEQAGLAPRDLEVVAVTVGPGSFTGLRIGVTTAKTLAYSLQCDLAAVNTLDVIARQTPPRGERLWAAIDAHRSQLFVGEYTRDEARGWRRANDAGEFAIVGVENFLACLAAGDVVSGPVAAKLALRLPAEVRLAPEAAWMPDASTVAQLAAELHAAGRRDDFWSLVPQYGRLSAAEEKRGKGVRGS